MVLQSKWYCKASCRPDTHQPKGLVLKKPPNSGLEDCTAVPCWGEALEDSTAAPLVSTRL